MKVFTYIKNDSCRVHKKNFHKIGNLELWKHLVYELRDEAVYIDTDSDEIIQACNQDLELSHVYCYRREQRFIAMENDPENRISPALLMLENFLDKHVIDPFEKIVLIHVTSPFLKRETILDALKYLDKGYEFVHSVFSVQDFAWLGKEFKPLNFDPSVVQRTQDVEEVHFSNGAFFIFNKRNFKKYKNRLGDKNFYYKLNNIEAIEIDTIEDLKLAKIIYKGVNQDD
jgi:CMP-N-acetylneuraminic acid synthetase